MEVTWFVQVQVTLPISRFLLGEFISLNIVDWFDGRKFSFGKEMWKINNFYSSFRVCRFHHNRGDRPFRTFEIKLFIKIAFS